MNKVFNIIAVALLVLISANCLAQRPLPPHFRTPAQRATRQQQVMSQERDYGSNMVRLIPLRILDQGSIGFGLDYEYIFGREKNIGLVLPISILFPKLVGYYSESSSAFIYFSPGIKIYPFGQRQITYAVGPNLMVGYGIEKFDVSKINSQIREIRQQKTLKLGLFANNYLNVQLSSVFNFGVELGLGVRYLDANLEVSGRGRDYVDIQPAVNFALSFGYRF